MNTITLKLGSYLTGTTKQGSSASISSKFEVKSIEITSEKKYRTISDRIRELERDPVKRDGLMRARRRLAEAFDTEDGQPTFKSLRMSKGISQETLAHAIGNKQPYIAKIEAGNANLSMEVINKIASVFCMAPHNLYEIINRDREQATPSVEVSKSLKAFSSENHESPQTNPDFIVHVKK